MADGPSLTGARVLVVGASAGIGRAFVGHAVAMGAHVCASARRGDKLGELCAEAGGGHPIAADVTVAEDCERLVREAADALGGPLDLVLYTAGAGVLAPVAEPDAEVWRRPYEVNVVAPMLLCGAVLPVLSPDGLVSFLSSEAAGQTRWGLAAYSASKAALDTAIRFWRHEHPERRFQRIEMGSTFPTEFGSAFGREALEIALGRWAETGVDMNLMATDEVGLELAEALAVVLHHRDIDIPHLKLVPRGLPWPATEGSTPAP